MTATGTLTLTDFLLARIAEDEAAARGVYSLSQFWRTKPGWHDMGPGVAYFEEPADAEHVVRWSPDRVLAECEAKRRMLTEHETIAAAYPDCTIESDPCCGTCSGGGEYPGIFPCATLCLLTLPYADHPDFRDEWRP